MFNGYQDLKELKNAMPNIIIGDFIIWWQKRQKMPYFLIDWSLCKIGQASLNF